MANGLTLFVAGPRSVHTQEGESDMTWCGHNEVMSSGVTHFVGGLCLQTKKRADAEGVRIAEIPALEIEEIDALMGALSSSPSRDKLRGVMAVGELIRHFYVTLGEALAKDPSRTVEDVFSEAVATLNRQLFAMEEHYYAELRPKFPRIEAIRRIREFLESQCS